MGTIAELCTTAPDPAHGAEIGYEDWRSAVEVCVPASQDAGVWGFTVWGTAEWCDEFEWADVTTHCSGVHLEHGTTSPAATPSTSAGTLTFTEDPDALFCPWLGHQWPYLGEGTPLRVVLHSPADEEWFALFTGPIETMAEPTLDDTLGTARTQTVTVVGPLADIATLVRTGGGVVGEGDSPRDRVQRLLDDALWRWPSDIAAAPPPPGGLPTLEGSTLAGNVLAQAQLAALSMGSYVITAGTGAVDVVTKPPTGATWHTPYGAPGTEWGTTFAEHRDTIANATYPTLYGAELWPFVSARVWRDDEATVSDVSFTRATGTTPQTFRGGCRAGGDRTYSRTDLLGDSTADPYILAAAEGEWSARDMSAMRAQIDLDITRDPDLAPTIAALELFELVDLWREFILQPSLDGRLFRVAVTHIMHDITPLTGTIARWTCRLTGGITAQADEDTDTLDAYVPSPYGG